jgi:hypothetical protein
MRARSLFSRRRCRRREGRPNKRMQLTKLRAAPVLQAEVPPCAPAGRMDGGTASQLIRSVRQTVAGSSDGHGEARVAQRRLDGSALLESPGRTHSLLPTPARPARQRNRITGIGAASLLPRGAGCDRLALQRGTARSWSALSMTAGAETPRSPARRRPRPITTTRQTCCPPIGAHHSIALPSCSRSGSVEHCLAWLTSHGGSDEAAEQGVEADEPFGGAAPRRPRRLMRPRADGRAHRFAA